MKIVDRKTFLSLPADTLYSKYEPCVFGDLEIKGSTILPNDFATQQIADAVRCSSGKDFSDILFNAGRTGESFAVDFNCAGRDGLGNNRQLFVIWEQADIAALIERLTCCLQVFTNEGEEESIYIAGCGWIRSSEAIKLTQLQDLTYKPFEVNGFSDFSLTREPLKYSVEPRLTEDGEMVMWINAGEGLHIQVTLEEFKQFFNLVERE